MHHLGRPFRYPLARRVGSTPHEGDVGYVEARHNIIATWSKSQARILALDMRGIMRVSLAFSNALFQTLAFHARTHGLGFYLADIEHERVTTRINDSLIGVMTLIARRGEGGRDVMLLGDPLPEPLKQQLLERDACVCITGEASAANRSILNDLADRGLLLRHASNGCSADYYPVR